MPCVFPVLFIKIIGVIRIKNKKQSIIDSLNYMVGVVLSFLIIAFILRIFKQQGQILGWGFQLQSPYFVAIMAVGFFALGFVLFETIFTPSTMARFFSTRTFKTLPVLPLSSPEFTYTVSPFLICNFFITSVFYFVKVPPEPMKLPL